MKDLSLWHLELLEISKLILVELLTEKIFVQQPVLEPTMLFWLLVMFLMEKKVILELRTHGVTIGVKMDTSDSDLITQLNTILLLDHVICFITGLK